MLKIVNKDQAARSSEYPSGWALVAVQLDSWATHIWGKRLQPRRCWSQWDTHNCAVLHMIA